MRIKPTRGMILLLSAALVVLVAGTGALLVLQSSALSATLATVEAKEEEVLNAQKRERRREEALRLLEADRERLQFLEASVPPAAYVPTLLKQLEEVAWRTENRVLAVSPESAAQKPVRKIDQRRDPEAQARSAESGGGGEQEEKEPEAPYDARVIKVSLVGTYRSTQVLLERLMSFPKILAVEDIQIRPHRPELGEGDRPDLLDVELRVTAFVMKEPVAPGATQKPAVQASAQWGGTR